MDVDYHTFARSLWATGLISDPWVDGAPRFATQPVILSRAEAESLASAAEALTLAYDEANQLCIRNPGLLASYFHLTPWQTAMWAASDAEWHGLARADVFVTDRGIKICELNSDTPTGIAEAAAVSRALGVPPAGTSDPNDALLERITALVSVSMQRIERLDPGAQPSVAIVYPTDLSEDLGLVALYRHAFAAQGWRVTLGSPGDVDAAPDDRVAVAGTICDAVFRHYKTDAWGERSYAWLDVPPPPDAEPLERPLTVLLRAAQRNRCAIVNPFGAVLTQNKRMMALMWEARDQFSPDVRNAVEAFLPYTARLENIRGDLGDQERWVLKSDYGCEGDEVIIGRAVTRAVWKEVLETCDPTRWIAQECFEPLRLEDGQAVNHGVYLVAGRASGLYARLDRGATDRKSLSAAIRVRDGA